MSGDWEKALHYQHDQESLTFYIGVSPKNKTYNKLLSVNELFHLCASVFICG